MKSNLEMMKIIEAYANGHAVEFYENGEWEKLDGGCSHVCWNMLRYDYRIAPKPLECWVVWKDNEPLRAITGSVMYAGGQRLVKMREVTE